MSCTNSNRSYSPNERSSSENQRNIFWKRKCKSHWCQPSAAESTKSILIKLTANVNVDCDAVCIEIWIAHLLLLQHNIAVFQAFLEVAPHRVQVHQFLPSLSKTNKQMNAHVYVHMHINAQTYTKAQTQTTAHANTNTHASIHTVMHPISKIRWQWSRSILHDT